MLRDRMLVGTDCYELFEYIETDRSGQYIETDWCPPVNADIRLDLCFPDASELNFTPNAEGGTTGIFCAYDPWAYREFSANFGGNAAEYNLIYYWNDYSYGHGGQIKNQRTTLAIMTNRNIMRMTSNAAIYNGTRNLNQRTVANQTGLRLFASYSISKGGVWLPFKAYKLRLYGAKFYNGSTLERDLIPARRVKDGKVGLYCKVTGKFYPNLGGKEFGHAQIIGWIGK